MKNIKDITISIFAIIGFIALVMGFTNIPETQQPTQLGTPESHVWEMHLSSSASEQRNSTYAFSINKKTGEVRQHNTSRDSQFSNTKKGVTRFGTHRISIPK